MNIEFCSIKKYKEGFCYSCKQCRKHCSIYKGSIFSKKQIGPKTFKIIYSLWCQSYYARDCKWLVSQSTMSLGDSIFYQYYYWFRYRIIIANHNKISSSYNVSISSHRSTKIHDEEIHSSEI